MTDLPDTETTSPAEIALSEKSAISEAFTHGGTWQKLILASENQANFHALLSGLQSEYRPETQQDQLFVEQLALSHWFLWRGQRALNCAEASVYNAVSDDPEWLNENHFYRIAVARKHKDAAERGLKRAFQNAESIRKERKSQRDYLERHAKWQAEQQIREQRLQLDREKLKNQKQGAGLKTPD